MTCDRLASSTQGLFHRVPEIPKDSIGVMAFSKLQRKIEEEFEGELIVVDVSQIGYTSNKLDSVVNSELNASYWICSLSCIALSFSVVIFP